MRAAVWTEPTQAMREDHVLVVMTCDRTPAYLAATIQSLENAGLERWEGSRFIVADGYTPLVPGWLVSPSVECCGNAATFLRALKLVVDVVPYFSKLTLIEDDVRLARNALDYIVGVDMRGLLFVSWYSSLLPQFPGARGIFDIVLARTFFGNQAITLGEKTVRAVLRGIDAWPSRHNADRIVGTVLPDHRVGIHRPNLVQHTGVQSSIDARLPDQHPISVDFYTEAAVDMLHGF